MSIVLKTALAAALSFLAINLPANTLAFSSPSTASSRPAAEKPALCDAARRTREQLIRQEPSINSDAPIHTQGLSSCFTPDENLTFVAILEAQRVLGPNAPWYKELSQDVKNRVTEACGIMGYENSDVSRAYDYCLESRQKELMSPYEEKFAKESSKYLRKRQQVADSLVVRCDASLSVKRSQLPKNMRFPVAWYNSDSQSVPSWLLEEKLDDDRWLEQMGKLKIDNIMADVLGSDCPGEMIYWVTYDAPGL
ncbi:hypothetical protein [Endozoicomonas sp. SCSIO W0465]|uniref:hypothetical protein n=1 Tax=Endozoicomonas sp. SCSIO W0465 TaxID=2918516 RepID=UPI002074C6AA|nr:hypothetical protein [Endozoicomonas sp. SCSIO W0465]USE37159.1 hypothetical protein MJO57_02710 [Endozoicomonas sp. SCSIO W0465]